MCCYGTLFKVHQGVTKGDPLPPTIFNMLVDAVVCHWVTLVAGKEEVPYGFGWLVQWLAAFFYVDSRLLAPPRPTRPQVALSVFTGLFDKVGLQTNINKIVVMVCQPFYIVDGHLEEAYTRRITGMGKYFWERQREIFRCPD